MKRSVWILAVLLLASLFSGASAISEEEEGGAHAEGLCSGNSMYSIAIVPEIGLSFETEIHPQEESGSNPDRAGDRWRIKMLYNDILIMEAKRRADDDGAVEVHRVMGNLEGVDHLELKAANLDTGEDCWGTLQAEF